MTVFTAFPGAGLGGRSMLFGYWFPPCLSSFRTHCMPYRPFYRFYIVMIFVCLFVCFLLLFFLFCFFVLFFCCCFFLLLFFFFFFFFFVLFFCLFVVVVFFFVCLFNCSLYFRVLSCIISYVQGTFMNYAEKYSKRFIHVPSSKMFSSIKIDYWQLFMHANIGFNAIFSKLRLLRQR